VDPLKGKQGVKADAAAAGEVRRQPYRQEQNADQPLHQLADGRNQNINGGRMANPRQDYRAADDVIDLDVNDDEVASDQKKFD
jgi:hypothetical protein